MRDRLKQIREKLKKTHQEIADAVGVHKRGWQKYEKGENLPGSEVLQTLAGLGFNVNWILIGEGEMYIKPTSAAPSSAAPALPEAPAGLEPVYTAFVEVMISNDPGAKEALTYNVFQFQRIVQNSLEITELKRDMEAFKKIFKEGLRAREEVTLDTDLKKAAG